MLRCWVLVMCVHVTVFAATSFESIRFVDENIWIERGDDQHDYYIGVSEVFFKMSRRRKLNKMYLY